eukprot:scaffold11434_cov127-Isochrysis_galbana.AAC.3
MLRKSRLKTSTSSTSSVVGSQHDAELAKVLARAAYLVPLPVAAIGVGHPHLAVGHNVEGEWVVAAVIDNVARRVVNKLGRYGDLLLYLGAGAVEDGVLVRGLPLDKKSPCEREQ